MVECTLRQCINTNDNQIRNSSQLVPREINVFGILCTHKLAVYIYRRREREREKQTISLSKKKTNFVVTGNILCVSPTHPSLHGETVTVYIYIYYTQRTGTDEVAAFSIPEVVEHLVAV